MHAYRFFFGDAAQHAAATGRRGEDRVAVGGASPLGNLRAYAAAIERRNSGGGGSSTGGAQGSGGGFTGGARRIIGLSEAKALQLDRALHSAAHPPYGSQMVSAHAPLAAWLREHRFRTGSGGGGSGGAGGGPAAPVGCMVKLTTKSLQVLEKQGHKDATKLAKEEESMAAKLLTPDSALAQLRCLA
eukprot:jgi/Chrpa1/4873/Chrysochromulina_OHIO_Genome00011196-RA